MLQNRSLSCSIDIATVSDELYIELGFKWSGKPS